MKEEKYPNGIETFATPNSLVVGRTIEDLEKDYGIKFDHCHADSPRAENRFSPRRDYKIKPFQAFHIWGNRDSLNKFIDAIN